MSEVLCSCESGVARIRINRPDQRNALNPQVLAQLRHWIQTSGRDGSIRVITLTGEGDRVFCSGADLKASVAGPADNEAFGLTDFRRAVLDIRRCPKPVVALARGHVMGGGLGLLLACDLSLACDDVHFSTPEVLVGMFPMMVLALLHRNVGRKRAVEMMFLGERISATTAREWGIVNHVFPRQGFEEASADFIGRLAEKSTSVLGLGKEAMLHLEENALARELEYLEAALVRVMSTEDSREGIRAFVEKRKPRWKHN